MATPLRRPKDIVPDGTIPDTLITPDGGRPGWLLVPYALHTWVVTDTGDKPNRSIRFNVGLPGGMHLADYPHLLDSIKRVTYGMRTGPLMSIESGSTQAAAATNLIVLARWMITNQIDRFEDLTLLDVQEYAQVATFGVHAILNTEGVLSHYLAVLAHRAGFDANDRDVERRYKAAAVFPLVNRPSGKRTMLAREQLMRDAGLDGVGLVGSKSVVVTLLDDVEALCRFARSQPAKERSKHDPSLDELDDEEVTEEHLRRLLLPFEQLFRHRRYLEDGLQINPFPVGGIRSIVRVLGKEVGRTATVPVKQAATFLERSIRWIVDFAPRIIELKDRADGRYDRNKAFRGLDIDEELHPCDWPSQGTYGPSSPQARGAANANSKLDEQAFPGVQAPFGMSFRLAINFLLTACAAVIAAFSARRAAEILGLKVGCIERDESGQPWMRVFIHKTGQAESIVPVPEVVVAAVSVLEKISLRARTLTGTPYLMQYNLPGGKTCVGLTADGRPNFRLGNHLRCFGYLLDVPAMPDGSRWTFRPHQFRRFFAILYIWIYELGDWEALSDHLRHSHSEMTRRYASDPELGHIIALANREHTAAILADAALGHSRLGGAQGTRLKEAAKRIHAHMAQRVQVVSERKFQQRIMRFVERAGITLHAFPWGYCVRSVAPSGRRPACSGSSSNEPHFASATVSTCGGCAFNLRTGSAAPYVANTLEFHRKVASAPDTPEILRRASLALSNELVDYMADLSVAASDIEAST